MLLAVTIPTWLLAGVLLGVVLSAIIAGIFYVGVRRFDDGGSARAGHGGGDRRRREVRRYLEAIGEPYEEDREIAGATVAFYLPERDVAITFDARAFFRIEDEVTPVLLEHELPGANVGSRLPFETPEFGTRSTDAATGRGPVGSGARARAASHAGARAASGGARAASDSSAASGERAVQTAESQRRLRAAFAALGLPPDADADAVETAYRRRIKEVHPDQGGDREQFRRVREAYELASERAD